MPEPTLAELFAIVQRLGETVQKGVDVQLRMSDELTALRGSRAELFSLVSFVLWAVVRNSQVNRAGLQEDRRQLSAATAANGEDFVSAALRSLAQTASGEGPGAAAQ